MLTARLTFTVLERLATIHACIVRELAGWDSGTPIVSEEGAVPGFEERRNWTRFWLVDPLDGTKELIAGNGEYTVNIALIEDASRR